MAGSNAEAVRTLERFIKLEAVQKVALPALALLLGIYVYAPGFCIGLLFGVAAVIGAQLAVVVYFWRKVQSKVKSEDGANDGAGADAVDKEDEPVPLDFGVREV